MKLELSTIAMLVLAGAYLVLALVAFGILVSKRLHPEPRTSPSAQRRYYFSVAFYVLITLMGLLRAACLVVEELWSDYFFSEASHWQLLVLALPTFMYLSVEFLMLGYWYECLHVSLRRDSVLDTFLIWLSEGVRPVYVVVGMTVVGYATIMPNFLWCLLQGCNEYLPIITYVYVNSIYFLLAAAFVVMSYRLVVLSGSKEFSLIGTLAHFVMWVTAIGLFFRGVIGMLEFSPAYRAWADPIEWIQVGYYGVLEFLQVVAVLLGLHAIKSTLRQMHFSRLNDDASDSE